MHELLATKKCTDNKPLVENISDWYKKTATVTRNNIANMLPTDSQPPQTSDDQKENVNTFAPETVPINLGSSPLTPYDQKTIDACQNIPWWRKREDRGTEGSQSSYD